MANVQQMDYEEVAKAADGFENAHNMLVKVSTALEAALRILQTTAFIGYVGRTAVMSYINNIKPRIDKLAATCREMSGDLREAIRITREKDSAAISDFKN